MKNIVSCIFLLIFSIAFAQKEKYHRHGKTLVITNQDPSLSPKVKKGLKKTFFKTYPKMVRDFNPHAIKTVQVTIDTSYTGVAYAANGKITISSAWLHKKPKDYDVITHETMHLVQAYPNHSGPGWLIEGIADYARFKYGIYNDEAGWSLTAFSPKQSYKNSYRITARFLEWITENYKQNLVKLLDSHLRNKTYSNKLWKEYTGKSLDELWNVYRKNPKLN